MPRPEAEKAVVSYPQYAEFAAYLEDDDPTEDLDFTLEF